MQLVDAPANCRIAVHLATGARCGGGGGARGDRRGAAGAAARNADADRGHREQRRHFLRDRGRLRRRETPARRFRGWRRQTAATFTALPPDASGTRAAPPRPQPAASGGLVSRIAALQTAFNRDLTEALKALKEGGGFWWLGGISFLYGIVHAAGPGHGKVVISSYLLANEQRVRRGVAIAFLAAFAQALAAIGIVGVMAAILNMTSMAITGTAKFFEAGSFALVAALGLYLLIRKGRQALAMLRGGDGHAHHHHGHHVRIPTQRATREGR